MPSYRKQNKTHVYVPLLDFSIEDVGILSKACSSASCEFLVLDTQEIRTGSVVLLYGDEDKKLLPSSLKKNIKLFNCYIPLHDNKTGVTYIRLNPDIPYEETIRIAFSRINASYTLVETQKQYKEMCSFLKNKKEPVSLDVETSSLSPDKVGDSEILCMSVGDEDHTYVLPCFHKDTPLSLRENAQQNIENVVRLLNKNGIIAHNAKYELRWLRKYCGDDLPTVVFDTMLAHYLLDEGARHGLDDLTLEYLPEYSGYWHAMELRAEGNPFKNAPWQLIPIDALAKYNAIDVEVTHKLAKILWKKLKDDSLLAYARGYLFPLVEVIAHIEGNGFAINRKELNALRDKYTCMKNDEEFYIRTALNNDTLNINSNKQLAAVLYEDLKLPVLQRTETGNPSVSSDTLELLLDHVKNKEHKNLINRVLRYLKASYMLSSFINVYEDGIDNSKDGRLRTNFNQHVVETGRLSSSSPNLQNIPTDEALEENGYYAIKSIFVPSKKDMVLIQGDYGQIELRVAAMYSDDDVFKSAFQDGKDLHGETARYIFGDNYTDDQRNKAKRTNFSAIFDITPKVLAGKLHITEEEADVLLVGFRSMHPKLYEFFDRYWEFGMNRGYVVNYNNRKRHIYEELKRCNERWELERVKRQVWNFPIQSSAAEIALHSIGNLRAFFRDEDKYKTKMLGTVHDSLLVEVEKKNTKQAVNDMRSIMCDKIREEWSWITVPLTVDFKVGNSLHRMEKV